MCILLKFDYAKFGVSNLYFSKVIKERPLGAQLDPHLVKKGLIKRISISICTTTATTTTTTKVLRY